MGIMSHKIKHINDEVEIIKKKKKKEPYKFYGRIILILGKRKNSFKGFESKYVWWKNQQI